MSGNGTAEVSRPQHRADGRGARYEIQGKADQLNHTKGEHGACRISKLGSGLDSGREGKQFHSGVDGEEEHGNGGECAASPEFCVYLNIRLHSVVEIVVKCVHEMKNWEKPFYPIIYVRGYAMSEGEQDETTVDPFCGFNLGSAVYRATTDKTKARKFIFESPVLRLISDFEYSDVYKDGLDIVDAEWTDAISPRSIVIFRYYEQGSTILGTGKTEEIGTFAKRLSDLILKTRDLVCRDGNAGMAADFRCYLVAHSMGGLVCRAFLQNPELGDDAARQCVDKVFTYATPHNGIEMAGINIPAWLGVTKMNTFNREEMAKYLNVETLYARPNKRVDWLPESAFPSEKFFCMVGTNRGDFAAGLGMSRTFAGQGSDGLVKIESASVWGVDGDGKVSAPCATAYAFRSHSGFFGIVNSEESYQNLKRFLFGKIRIDIWVDVASVRLPETIEGKNVNAVYQFELLSSPQKKPWFLTRRVAEEDSVACRSHEQLTAATDDGKKIYMSTVFLESQDDSFGQGPDAPIVGQCYGIMLRVRVPDYEVDRKFWLDEHIEGAALFQGSVLVEVERPRVAGGDWTAKYDWQDKKPGEATLPLTYKDVGNDKKEMTIDFKSKGKPGISGKIRFLVSAWNG